MVPGQSNSRKLINSGGQNKMSEYKILTDEEALEYAKKQGWDMFSLNPANLERRIDVSAFSCPACQSKNVEIEPIQMCPTEVKDKYSNSVHSMKCQECHLKTTLWNIAIANNYFVRSILK